MYTLSVRRRVAALRPERVNPIYTYAIYKYIHIYVYLVCAP